MLNSLLKPSLKIFIWNILTPLSFLDASSKVDIDSGRKWTRGQVLEAALNFAAYLTDECELSAGDVVFFVCEYCDIHAIALIGVLFAGCVYGSIPDHSAKSQFIVWKINLIICDTFFQGKFVKSSNWSIPRCWSASGGTGRSSMTPPKSSPSGSVCFTLSLQKYYLRL